MEARKLDPPAPDQVEISLFGPGYGEAIAIHLGCGKWILVDSCLHPHLRMPSSLEYLDALRIDIKNAVALVVATHWHDDHVRGIGEVFDRRQSAALAISDVLQAEAFHKLVAFYREPGVITASGVDEFIQILAILETRRPRGAAINAPKFASADKVLYRENFNLFGTTVPITVYALSPSDASIMQAKIALDSLYPQEGQTKKRILAPSPNHAAVVLWIEIGAHRILLGADLEFTADPLTGWSVILNNSQVTSDRAFFFKIPHHGSSSAHDAAVWSQLLSQWPGFLGGPAGGAMLVCNSWN